MLFQLAIIPNHSDQLRCTTWGSVLCRVRSLISAFFAALALPPNSPPLLPAHTSTDDPELWVLFSPLPFSGWSFVLFFLNVGFDIPCLILPGLYNPDVLLFLEFLVDSKPPPPFLLFFCPSLRGRELLETAYVFGLNLSAVPLRLRLSC